MSVSTAIEGSRRSDALRSWRQQDVFPEHDAPPKNSARSGERRSAAEQESALPPPALFRRPLAAVAVRSPSDTAGPSAGRGGSAAGQGGSSAGHRTPAGGERNPGDDARAVTGNGARGRSAAVPAGAAITRNVGHRAPAGRSRTAGSPASADSGQLVRPPRPPRRFRRRRGICCPTRRADWGRRWRRRPSLIVTPQRISRRCGRLPRCWPPAPGRSVAGAAAPGS